MKHSLSLIKIKVATLLMFFIMYGLEAGEYYIRGEKFANWWVIGDTVSFKLGEGMSPKASPSGTAINRKVSSPLPSNTDSVIGMVFDSSGRQIDKLQVSAARFTSAGWQWRPRQPGLYSVKFHAVDSSGRKTTLSETYAAKFGWKPSPDDPKFTRDAWNFAVLPSPPRAPSQISRQLGVSISPSWSVNEWESMLVTNDIKEAALIGFNSIRIHPVEWSRMEKTQGKIDWGVTDFFIATARTHGFNNFAANIFGTPRWASPCPERDRINIAVYAYTAYAPVNISDWTNFIKAAVKRYPFIRKWELLNEPNLPGLSCYWSDSPENCLKMVKAGYETIKTEQPDAEIWFSGQYLSFYDRILALGGGKYFDVLSRHGQSWAGVNLFQQLDSKYDLPTKTWINGEFHAVVSGSGTMDGNRVPSESLIAHDMLVAAMNVFRNKARDLYFFSLSNNYGIEMEMAEVYKKAGKFFQTSGIFRRTPTVEPRLAAVVWRNFSDCFTGNIKYLDGFSFDQKRQSASLMESDAGQVLFVWSNTGAPQKACSELIAVTDAESKICDWEGKTISRDQFILEPEKIYFIKKPQLDDRKKWIVEQVLKPYRHKKEAILSQAFNANFREGKIFDSSFNTISSHKLPWQKLEQYVSRDKSEKNKDFSARFAVGFDNGIFELLVEVSDPVHHQTNSDGKVWLGDSVQFALDAQGNGISEDRLEICAARVGNNNMLFKEHLPVVGGDLPVSLTMERQQIRHGALRIERKDNMTIYKIRILREDLFPFSHLKGQKLRFSILVNNDDGRGRTGYLTWASGIGEEKDPALYGNLTIDAGNEHLMSQLDLSDKPFNPAKDVGVITKLTDSNGTLSMKVVSKAGKKQKATIYSNLKTVVPGAEYTCSFKARGDVPLIVLIKEYNRKYKEKRLDLGQLALTGAQGGWQNFSKSFTVSLDADRISVWIFCWEHTGFFEVKDFVVKTGYGQ